MEETQKKIELSAIINDNGIIKSNLNFENLTSVEALGLLEWLLFLAKREVAKTLEKETDDN